MTLQLLTLEAFQEHAKTVSERSFLQTEEMAILLQKRGMTVERIGLVKDHTVLVSALLYSLPMTGGLHMEINCGPITSHPESLPEFYRLLQDYARQKGALQLIVKPYQTYQTFDSNGQPTSSEQTQFITDLTNLGYQFDGLQTGYPGGEPDWHYVKDLTGLTPTTLRSSFSKKGKALAKKTSTFGIQLRQLKREELHLFKEITEATSERREYTDKSLDYYQDFYDAFGDHCEFMVASINFQDYLQNLQAGKAKLEKDITTLDEKLKLGQNPNKLNSQKRELEQQVATFDTRILEAEQLIAQHGSEDVLLAGSLFVYTPHESVYLFSGSYTEFNKFYAPMALQEHVMQESLRRGISFYNLLGITGLFDGTDGVLRFKQNFNGHIVRKMGTFRYYPNPLKYKMIQVIKKLLRRQ
ncbi:aminoacyltransferase [Streptococcus ovis]|uniref:aminoacyltransferase n=1 Tax=Streptococcus ovis TaxID=82806 RepID=UPI00036F1E55|nr:aminoacyltransferase [Streptococcus ovis]